VRVWRWLTRPLGRSGTLKIRKKNYVESDQKCTKSTLKKSRDRPITATPEIEMDWNRVEGNWKQVKGKVKERWGSLTHDARRINRPLEPITGVMLATEDADFVTITSSTANAVIDSTSAELTKRIAKEIEEIKKEQAAGLSITIK
jgi:hypothetical protein